MRYVYFIKPVGMDGPVKIGCSVKPITRKQQLEAWSPFDLEVAATIEGDDTLEARFHAALVNSHHRQEWFHATPEVLAMVEAVRSGTFDVNSLPQPLGAARHIKKRLATYTDLDWKYWNLRQEYQRLHDEKRWKLGPWPMPADVFHKLTVGSKLAHIAGLKQRLASADRLAA